MSPHPWKYGCHPVPMALLVHGHQPSHGPSHVWVSPSLCRHSGHLVPWVTTYTWTSLCPHVASGWTSPHPTVTCHSRPHCHYVRVDVTLSTWSLHRGGHHPVPMSLLMHGQHALPVTTTHTTDIAPSHSHHVRTGVPVPMHTMMSTCPHDRCAHTCTSTSPRVPAHTRT